VNYVLDTTLLIDHVNGLPAAVHLVESLFEAANTLYTCDAIVAEALSGGSEEQRAALRSIVDVLEFVSLSPKGAGWAGESRRNRASTSRRTLGDALIAAVAVFNDATIVTRNPSDFEAQGVPVLTYG
jgi:predicted nucleic acid-binding protein